MVLLDVFGKSFLSGIPCLVPISQSHVASFEGKSEMEIFVFCWFTSLFHNNMAIKKAFTFVICSILIFGVTGRIERPRGVAISSKYSDRSALLEALALQMFACASKIPNYRLFNAVFC